MHDRRGTGFVHVQLCRPLQVGHQRIVNSGLSSAGYVYAVRDVNLEVRRGEMLVVMGLSGSGKSTLVRCLSRLIEITGGSVSVEGRDIATLSEPELIDLRRRKMGMVFQSSGLLPNRSVLESVFRHAILTPLIFRQTVRCVSADGVGDEAGDLVGVVFDLVRNQSGY